MVKKENFLLVTVFILSNLCFFLTPLVLAETEVHLSLTASHLPTKFSDLPRQVSVITAEEIKSLPVKSISELLNLVSGVDLQTRGIFNVQSDITIRGSTFEQTVILIDGVRVNDPQTGHHNSDLPLTLQDIEKIEILHGHGSSLYGSNAVGGAINIITKKPKEKELTTKFSYGNFNTYQLFVSADFPWRKSTISYEKSDGYPVPEKYLKPYWNFTGKESRFNYNFDIFTIFSNFHIGSLTIFRNLCIKSSEGAVGAVIKKFSGYDFYTPESGFPSKETTATYFFRSSIQGSNDSKITTFARIYLDEFILDETSLRTKYKNEHWNSVLGIDLRWETKLFATKFIFGSEPVFEFIISTGTKGGLGNHGRTKTAFYGESQIQFGEPSKLTTLNLGLRSEYNDFNQQWQHSPTISISKILTPRIKLRSSLGRTYRLPSFTELYCEDLVNKGDSNLKIESAWSEELGFDLSLNKNSFLSFTVFHRDEKDVIDWIQVSTSPKKFQVNNLGQIKRIGIEMTLKYQYKKTNTKINYTFIETDTDTEYPLSKYALRNPIHQVSTVISYPLPYQITQTWTGVYKERKDEKGYFLFSTQLIKKIKNNFEIFLSGSNLLNEEYEEILGVPQPGRWLGIGINWSYN